MFLCDDGAKDATLPVSRPGSGRNEALENAIGEIRDAAYEPDTTLATLKRHIAPNPCDRAQR